MEPSLGSFSLAPPGSLTLKNVSLRYTRRLTGGQCDLHHYLQESYA